MVAKGRYSCFQTQSTVYGAAKVRRDLSWMRIQIISYFGQRLARRLTSLVILACAVNEKSSESSLSSLSCSCKCSIKTIRIY